MKTNGQTSLSRYAASRCEADHLRPDRYRLGRPDRAMCALCCGYGQPRAFRASIDAAGRSRAARIRGRAGRCSPNSRRAHGAWWRATELVVTYRDPTAETVRVRRGPPDRWFAIAVGTDDQWRACAAFSTIRARTSDTAGRTPPTRIPRILRTPGQTPSPVPPAMAPSPPALRRPRTSTVPPALSSVNTTPRSSPSSASPQEVTTLETDGLIGGSQAIAGPPYRPSNPIPNRIHRDPRSADYRGIAASFRVNSTRNSAAWYLFFSSISRMPSVVRIPEGQTKSRAFHSSIRVAKRISKPSARSSRTQTGCPISAIRLKRETPSVGSSWFGASRDSHRPTRSCPCTMVQMPPGDSGVS